MGPSGAGKTSLLHVLSKRHSTSGGEHAAGQVFINGRELKAGDFGRVAAFVQQDDVLGESLTARELFTFACRIRLHSDEKQVTKTVNEVIQRLSLTACCDQIIGGFFRRGVSGGERKRISIGYELITNPSLMLLDEPSSGLDSSTSLRIVKQLRREARRGMSVLATVHQPSSELLNQFDRVICLSEGYVIYDGTPSGIMSYFQQFGLRVSTFANPADKLINIASAPFSEIDHSTLWLARVTPKYPNFTTEKVTENQLERNVCALDQLRIILQRQILETKRNAVTLPVMFLLGVFNGVLYCSLYYRINDVVIGPNPAENSEYIKNLLGLAFLVVSDQVIEVSFGQIMIIPLVYPIYRREVLNNMYRPWPFFMARVLMTVVTFVVYPLSVSLTIIWWLGLPSLSFRLFCEFWLSKTLIALVGSALGLTVGALFPNPVTALNLNQTLIILFTFGGGFYVNTGSGATLLVKAISWVSPLKYGSEMLFRLLLRGKPEEFQVAVLEDLGFTHGFANCVLIMLGWYVLYLLVGLASMYRLARA